MEQSPSEAGRALNALRRTERKVCAHCGKEFVGLTRARCCSQSCTVAVYWAAHREELNAKRRQLYRDQKAKAAHGEAVPEG